MNSLIAELAVFPPVSALLGKQLVILKIAVNEALLGPDGSLTVGLVARWIEAYNRPHIAAMADDALWEPPRIVLMTHA